MLKWIRLGYALPFLMFAFGLLVTHRLYLDAQRKDAQMLQVDFDAHVRDAATRVEHHMATYEQVLRGVKGLFVSSVSVERDEFHAYVNMLRLAESYPGIQALRFSPIVPPAQKDQHIAAMRRQGFPGYAIWPEGRRDFYAPVTYIEPFDARNQVVFGYDMYSDFAAPINGDPTQGLRRAAMEKARDSGECISTGKVRLVFENNQDAQSGFLMFLPIYRNGMPHDTVAARRASLVGWVSAVFRMDDLMQGILGEYADELDFEIYDGDEISDRTLMHHSITHGAKLHSLFHAARSIKVDNRPWTMVIHSMPRFEARLDRGNTRIIANTGIDISLLLALLTGLLVHGRVRALNAAQAVAESEARLRDTFENMSSAVLACRVSPDGQDFTIVSLNQAVERIEKVRREDVIGKNVVEAFPGITAFGLLDALRRVWKSGVAEYLSPVFYQDERVSGWREGYAYKLRCGQVVVIYDDVTERKQAEEQEHHMARHDTLTGLPNRILLGDRISQAIAKAKRDKTCLAILFVDLDLFKPVNDDLGHDIGDQVLKEVAQRLQDCMRESDTAARIGGDEFIVLLPIIEAEQDAMAVAEKIRHALCQPFELAGHSICISSSIGITIYPDHGSEEKLLISNADIAMYHAKENGRNNVQVFQDGMQEKHDA